ncbi:LOW QUALITY PROTEIN: olfactory receptor 11L1 [Chelonia mydas]|uniref:LOW QUALITY PROTEIN: olfactory receptor 11L1 n=1 Tax=Chelonia mydas TaxID=8469 RepID=UPI000FFB9601|nr:LOW QUALITY PROTEIN: olfactory receptor 11L1 [Chelonia mydas]
MENRTSVTEFILLGFPLQRELRLLSITIFLAIYLITVLSQLEADLRTPMYFFLSNFSPLEICYTSVTVPWLLGDFQHGHRAISFRACITQMYFFFFFGSTEFFLLATTAYDLYLAICHPLHYPMLMDGRACARLALASWVSGFLTPFLPTAFISQLPVCGTNWINPFFCDTGPLLRLSTGDTHMASILIFLVSAVVVLSSFLLTLTSYTLIVSTICHIPSTGRHKAFSTCASHLTVVTIFYGTVIFMYIRPGSGRASDMDKVMSVFYAIIILLLNPVIYTLRNRDFRRALGKALRSVKATLTVLT